MDDQQYLYTSTSRRAETWRIKNFAIRPHVGWGREPDEPVYGLMKRRSRNAYVVTDELSRIQKAYDDHPDDAVPSLAFRAILLLWPKLVDPEEFYRRPKLRSHLRGDRYSGGFYLKLVMMMAAKLSHADNDIFSLPRLTLRPRTRSEKSPLILDNITDRKKDRAAEIIGMEVMREYVRYGSASIDAACKAIADLGEVEGVSTGAFESVRKHYLRFRRVCHERGYVDRRAYQAVLDAVPWPNDQIWLEDFPSPATWLWGEQTGG